MRIASTVLLVAALALCPITTASASADVALRVEGYMGYANLDLGFVDLDGFQGGGAASVSAVFGELYLQGDFFGNAIHYEQDVDAKTIGPGLHLGWRAPESGSFGVVGTYNDLDLGVGNIDVFRAGIEGEAFFDQLTLGLNAGYTDVDGGANGYVDGLVALYPNENTRLNFRIGALGVGESDPLINLGLGGELLANEVLALFLRWEAALPDDFGDIIQNSVVIGMTLYWDADTGTLRGYDRSRFKQSCAGTQLIGRLC